MKDDSFARANDPDELVNECRELLKRDGSASWAVGDMLVALIDGHGWPLGRVSQAVGYGKPFLSQLYRAALAYPAERRKSSASWRQHHLARYAAERVSRAVSVSTGTNHAPDYADALSIVSAVNAHRPREATAAVRDEARKRLRPKAAAIVRPSKLLNNCHHLDCRQLIPRIADESLTIGHLDPPYAQYRKFSSGEYDASSSVSLSQCDNGNAEDAVAVTCDALRLIAPKLARGGCVLLWQSAAELRLPIHQTAVEAGFEFDAVVVWAKGRTMPGDFETCYERASEFLYVLKRVGDKLVNRDGSARSNVLSFAPVQHSTAVLEPHHMFEKPDALNTFLLGKHSDAGEIVADLFGCTGSFCRAAAAMGRQWIYCESNRMNFETFAPSLLTGTKEEAA